MINKQLSVLKVMCVILYKVGNHKCSANLIPSPIKTASTDHEKPNGGGLTLENSF